MAVGKKPGAIPGSTDGNKLVLCSIDPTTFAVSTPSAGTTAYDLGDIASSTVSQSVTESVKKAENGATMKTTYVKEHTTEAVLGQEDKDLLDFLGTGGRYLEIKYNGYINSAYQWIFKFVDLSPQFNIVRSSDNSNLNYKSTGVNPPSAVTISATTLASIANVLSLSNFITVDVTVPVVAGYVIAER